jgi:hypothetical protein
MPGYTPNQYAAALLKLWGAPNNATNLDTLTKWMSGESGGYNPASSGGKYNPLNIVATPGDRSTGAGGSQGDIADFGSFADGVAATAAFFNVSSSPKKMAILNNLRASNQAATFAAINSFYSTWGGTFAPGAAPSNTSTGTPTSTSSGAGAGATPDTSADSDCVWKLTMPGPIPNLCVTHSQGRALLGVATMAAGVGILIVSVGLAGKRQAANALRSLLPV